MGNTVYPENFGVYLVSFRWDGPGAAPANYPQGYKYWLNYDDAGIVGGAWHPDNNTEADLGPDTIYEDEYPYPPSNQRGSAYAPSIAGAASGPLLAAPLPPGMGLVPVPQRQH